MVGLGRDRVSLSATDQRLPKCVLGVPREILWGNDRPRDLSWAALARRTTGRVGNADPANERLRARARREYWQMLAAEEAAGAFDGECPWLAMHSLRQSVICEPSDGDQADIRTVIRMMPAIRMSHLAERYGAVSGRAPRRKTA